jgi:hypothetical protein
MSYNPKTPIENCCPRCGLERLRTWNELSNEGRDVARRLAPSADYTLEERKARHLWCTRCWHEETGGAARDV